MTTSTYPVVINLHPVVINLHKHYASKVYTQLASHLAEATSRAGEGPSLLGCCLVGSRAVDWHSLAHNALGSHHVDLRM